MKTVKFTQDRQLLTLVLVVLSLGVFSFFFNLGGRTIENQDNLRLAEVGREILETGDWVLMHLGGLIYVDKPPLHFWNTALAYKLFGTNTFAARLPSAFFGLLGFMAVLAFCLSVCRETPKTGIYAALFLISNYGYAYYARTARQDMEYAVLFSLSLISFYLGCENREGKGKLMHYALFWILTGLAFLEKGPVAFIPLLIAAIYLLLRRDWKTQGLGALAASFPLFILVVLPWLVLLYRHNDFSSYMDLLEHSKIMTRREGFFYYVPAFIINFFPGSIFFVISIPFVLRRWSSVKVRPWLLFCIIWIAVYFVLIHLTSVKALRYLLPVFLPVSVVAAWATDRMFSEDVLSHNLRGGWKALVVIFGGLVCLVPTAWTLMHGGQFHRGLVLSLAGFGGLFFVLKKTRDVVIFVCVLCMMGLLSLDLIRTTYNEQVSHNLALYKLLREHSVQPDEIFLYKTDREIRKMLGFYYNRLPGKERETVIPENKVRAVVAPPDSLEDVRKVYGPNTETVTINRGEGAFNYVVVFVLKHPSPN